MHLLEVRAVEQPALDGRRFRLGRGHILLGIASLNHLTPPPVTGPIADDRQQPSRQLRLIDRGQIAMEREERFGGQIFSHLAFPRDAEGESEHGLDVLTV